MPGLELSKIEQKKSGHNTKQDKSERYKEVMGWLNKDISLQGRKFSNKKRQSLYNDLQVLLASGVDISTAFELVAENFKKKDDIKLINRIRDNIIHGMSFSEALENERKFSEYEYYSIKIGEETGRMIQVLKDLADYYEKKIEQRRRIVSSFSYPVIVIITAFGAVFFMLKYIVPMFEDVFKRFGNELPGVTKFIIRLSHGFSEWFFPFVGIILLLVALGYIFRKKTWYRRYSSALMLRLPVFGTIIRKVNLSRFCLSMELLLLAKTPILNTIRLVKKMIGFYPLEHSLEMIEHDIINGKPLYQCLKKYPVYDKRMTSLVKVAEEVNQLDVIFGKLKDQYNKEVEYQTSVIGNIMEPVMIIFIGVFVGAILISMYLPMFQLSTSFEF